MRISPDTQKALLTYMMAVLIVIGSAMTAVAYHAQASEPQPTAQDYIRVNHIKQNQPRITESRPGAKRVIQAVQDGTKIDPKDVKDYNTFVENKAWNASEVDALAKNGWCLQWDTMKLEQCSGFPRP